MKSPLLRFLLVGGAAAIIQLGVLRLMAGIAALPDAVAVSAAYGASVLFHFFANLRFTFGLRGDGVLARIPRYIVVAIINYAITLVVVGLLTRVAQFGLYSSAIMAIAATTGFGFIASRHWVFSSGTPRNE